MSSAQEFRRSRIVDGDDEKDTGESSRGSTRSSALKKRLKDAWAVRKNRSREATGTHSTPLHIAATHNRLAACQFLLARKADVDAQNKYGDTASQHAAALGHLEVLRFLIQQGADIDHKGTTRGVSRKSVREYADDSMEVREAMERGIEEYSFLSENSSGSESAVLTTENLKTWMKQQQDKGVIDEASSLTGAASHQSRSSMDPDVSPSRGSFSANSESRSERSATLSISDFSEFSSRDIMNFDEIKLEEGMTLSDYYDELRMPNAHDAVSVASTGSYQSSIPSQMSGRSSNDYEHFLPEIKPKNVIQPEALTDLKEFFQFVKQHLRHRSIIVQTNIPHSKEWLDGSTMNMKSRSRTTRELDKEIELYNKAVRQQTSILHGCHVVCVDHGSVNQGTVEFSFPDFDTQLFFVSELAIVEAWNFFIGSSVRCWSDECWDNALQSECIGKEFMQSNTDISLWFTANDPETRSKTKKIAFNDQVALLHNLSLAAHVAFRKRDLPIVKGEKIFYKDVLVKLPDNKNKKLLSVSDDLQYLYNPTPSQLEDIVKIKESSSSSSSQQSDKQPSILATPVEWLITFRHILKQRYVQLCSLINSIRKWQGVKKQKTAKSKKKRSNRRWAVELLEKATREELEELSDLIGVIPEIHELQALTSSGDDPTATPSSPSRMSFSRKSISGPTRERLFQIKEGLTRTPITGPEGIPEGETGCQSCINCGSTRQIDESTGEGGKFCIKCGQEYVDLQHTPQTTWVKIVELVNDAADQRLLGEHAASNLVQLITDRNVSLYQMAEPLITSTNIPPEKLTQEFAAQAKVMLKG